MNILKLKNKLFAVTIFFILLLFVLPNQLFAADIKVDSIDGLQAAIDSANDGDRIDLVNLFSKKGYKSSDGVKRSININKNITITSSDPKNTAYLSSINQIRAVFIDNINFNIAKDKQVNLNGYLYLRGSDDKAVFTGDGNLVITDRVHIEGKNANPAINLPNSSVEIKNIMSYGDYESSTYLPLKYRSEILGGNSKETNGASAIVAKDISVIQDDLSDFDAYTQNGLFISGGCALNESYQGGYALEGENIIIDLSGENNSSPLVPIIVGGSGGYGNGAIKGKNINILCAGNNKIEPGKGVSLDVSPEKINQFYHGVIEVENDGHLIFASKEVADPFKFNSIEGFDNNNIQYGNDKDKENFFKDKNWANFYGPTIWAKGNASVDIKAGNFFGIGANFSGPSSDKLFMDKLPIEPIIKMEKGILNVGEKNQIKRIHIGGSNHHFNTSKTIISSESDINVYGANTEIIGPNFADINDKTGYINNPIAPKTGSSAIETKGEVLVDGANIIGGNLGNINTNDASLRNQYRKGSAIVGAKKVILENNAIVQGRGAIIYTLDGFKSSHDYLYNISAGHGLENVGQVIINNSEVHGGDIDTVPEKCTESGSCVGSGLAGTAIKAAEDITINGSSLITGGSSYNLIKNNSKILFSDRMPAGSAIDGLDSNNNIVTKNVSVSGNTQIYGGGSSTKAGHGIANAENVVVSSDNSLSPTIFGGGCRNTNDSGNESAGSGLYNVGDATISAGNIESGNKLYQTYIEKYADKMHPKTKYEGFVGTSKDASAIFARGKVIIDGDENSTPEIKSYYTKPTTPIESIRLDDSGSLYIGKAKVFSGGDESYRTNNILVKGGKYHVDIFKDNTINSYQEKEDSSIIYNSQDSTALYRILKNINDEYVDTEDSSLKNSPAYDDIFLVDKNINLYRENESLSKEIQKVKIVRKDKAQLEAVKDIESKEKIKIAASDNIIIGSTFSIIYDLNLPVDAEIETQADPPTDHNNYLPGEEANILDIGNIKLKNYKFLGWNTKTDGSGQNYKAGDKINIEGDVLLYASWQAIGDHNPDEKDKTIDIKVEKIWSEPLKASYPTKIDLYANGNKLENYSLILSEDNNWTDTFKNLPANKIYTVKEYGEEDGKITFNNKDSYKVYVSDLVDGTIKVTNSYISDQESNNIIPQNKNDKPLFPWLELGNYENYDSTKKEEEIQNHIAYIFGYPDSSIRPDGNITRAEAAALAIRLAGLKADDMSNNFEDCEEDAWYNSYINKAYKDDMLIADCKKIMPNQNITRAEFAKLISKLDEDKQTDLPFTDTKGHIFEKEIEKAYANGRIDGYPNNTFRPDAEITRAEAVKILNSLFNRVADRDYINEHENELKQFIDLNASDWFYYDMVEAANSHEYVRKENGIDELWKRILKDLNS